MKKPSEREFENYKEAEVKALNILKEMKSTGGSKVDIELALLVSIFELHKGSVASESIAKIINGHLDTLIPYYKGIDPAKN